MTLLDVINKMEAEARHPDAPKELAALVLMLVERVRPAALEIAKQLDDSREQTEEWKKLVVELAAEDPIHSVSRYGDVEFECFFCCADTYGIPPTHEADCLWQRAKGKL